MTSAATPSSLVALTAVIVTVSDNEPRVLVIEKEMSGLPDGVELPDTLSSRQSLPIGDFDPAQHQTLEKGMRKRVEELTGVKLNYIEQLYSFGNSNRDPLEMFGGPRLVSVGYLALTHEVPVSGYSHASWHDIYDYFPWEDWRQDSASQLTIRIRALLHEWCDTASSKKERLRHIEKVSLSYGGDDGSNRDPVKTVERFEILYEANLIHEAMRDHLLHAHARGETGKAITPTTLPDPKITGNFMALDNRRIIAVALSRLRGKLAYRPVVFDLLPQEFTLFQLQQVVEALSGTPLHKQNFRRTVSHGGLVEPTGKMVSMGRGRPAELFRFRRDVLQERPKVGVGLPSLRTSGTS